MKHLALDIAATFITMALIFVAVILCALIGAGVDLIVKAYQ